MLIGLCFYLPLLWKEKEFEANPRSYSSSDPKTHYEIHLPPLAEAEQASM